MSSTNVNREKILERVRRLLAMAEDKSSPHEAEIAMIRAAKLIKQYQIDEFTELGKVDSSLVEEVAFPWTYGRRIPGWVTELGQGLALFFDTRLIYKPIQVDGRMRVTLAFQGYEEDVQVCVRLMKFYIDQVNFLYKKIDYPCNSQDFYAGMASRIYERLEDEYHRIEAERKAAEAASAETSSGTSLVVFKGQQIVEHFGNLKTRNVKYRDISEDTAIGYTEGAKVTLFEHDKLKESN